MSPRRARELQRARIEAAMSILSSIMSGEIRSRDEARKRLQEEYRGRAVQPIRGKAWPPDIWDKELATVYVVGKYALMLDEEAPEVFNNIFAYEETLEDAINIVSSRNGEDARKLLLFLLGGNADDNTVARLLRIATTKFLLGFSSEDEVINLIRRLAEILPEQYQTLRKYARYFIALRVAQAIASGSVRSRIEKEALKQALAAKIGLEKIMPDDEYIEFIATNVFNAPKKLVQRVLSPGRSEKSKRLNPKQPPRE